MLKNLHDSLLDYDLPMLRAVARARGHELHETRQPEAVKELSARLLTSESVEWALSRLDERGREALDALLRAGGEMKLHIFTHHYGPVRAMGPGRLEREKVWMEPETPAEQLWFTGLMFRTFAEVSGGHRAEFVYVPSDVLPLLPPVAVVTPTFRVSAVEAPAVIRTATTALVDALFALLVNLQMHPAPLERGELTRSARRRTHRYMHLPFDADRNDPEGEEPSSYVQFLYHLSLGTKLARETDRRLKPNPDEARRWLKWRRDQQLFFLQRFWSSDPTWNELRHIPSLELEDTGWTNDTVMARQAILGHLKACPPGAWLSLESFIAAVKAVDPDFARPDGDYRSWYIRDARTGVYLMDFACWDYVERELIVHLLNAPLHWLGAVDLGFSGEDVAEPEAFRLNPNGLALLGLADPPSVAEAAPPSLLVRDDFTIHLDEGGRLFEQFQLHRFAQLKEGRKGRGLVFQITRSSLATAHQQGISPKMILSLLQRLSPTPLPTRVLKALRHWHPSTPHP